MTFLLLCLLGAIIPRIVAGPLQPYSYNYEDFIIFNNVGHANNVMYLQLEEGIDILFLENKTDPSLYRIEINEEAGGTSCVLIALYNDADGKGKMTDYSRRVCNLKEKVLKVNWDSTKVTIHQDDTTLFHFSNEIKFPKVNHVSVKPKFSSEINYKNTYTFIARLAEICKDGAEPVLVCHLEVAGKQDISRGVFIRADFYKTKTDNDYEIKAFLGERANVSDSFFTILKNAEPKLMSVVQPLLNRKIKLIIDPMRHHTSIHNPEDIVPLILWNEEDASYMESFNYVIVQNLKIHNSTFSDIYNSNNCRIKCSEKKSDSWWGKLKTFAKAGGKVHKYCENTDFLRE
jgi:hypothetical protein